MTEAKDVVEGAIDKLKPVLAKLSFGAIMGYCSAMALKKVGKALAIIVGLGFIGMQTAASTGYLAVDWTKIWDDVKSKADTNADGKFDTEDVKVRLVGALFLFGFFRHFCCRILCDFVL